LIPKQDIVGVTVILLTCSYKDAVRSFSHALLVHFGLA
jgi:hypothetical protein